MNKQRKTSNILNVFQYDETTGAVTLPSTLVLTAPAGSDNSTKVPTTAWTRSYISSLGYVTGNQSISIIGDATGSGTTSIELTLANTAVTPGTYGSATLVPVVTVDSKGRITSVTTASISGALAFTGDVTGTGTTGSSTTLTLANSGVTAGTFTKVTVDSKGRVTVGANATTSDISEGTNLYYTDARVLAYLGANNYATQSYVSTQINNLVSGAPGLLDTLDELAQALGDDPNFATTTATSLGNRLRIDIGTQGLSSTQQGYGRTNLGLGTAALSATGDFATAAQGTKADTAHGWGNHASAGYLTSYSETDTLASVTARGSSTTGSITINGYATLTGGADLNLKAASGSTDTGDIVFQDGSGNELHRLYQGSGTLSYRTNGGTTYQLWHSGNLTNLNQLSNGPGYITGYTEIDTLASVTSRGSSTNSAITINNTLTLNTSSTQPVLIYGDNAATNGLFRIQIDEVNDSFGSGARTFLGDGGIDIFIGTGNSSYTPANSYIALNHSGEISMGAGSATKHFVIATSGAATFSSTISASNFSGSHSGSSSGTNTGDQTNISGQSGSSLALSGTGGITSAPATNQLFYTGQISAGASGLFAANDNANSIITLNRHPGAYDSQLGFSSNGNLYYRNFVNTSINTTQAWQLIWTSSNLTNLNQLSNGPGYITSYSETDTLNSVTSRGNTTSNSVRFGTHVDISPTGSAFRFYDGTTFRGGFGLDSWGHSGSDANLVLYVNGDNSLFFSTSGTKRASLSSSAFNSLVALQQSGNQVLHAGNYSSYALPLSGGTMTGTLAMHEGAYYGTITFGSSSYWRAGISQRDAGNAELRIWAKGGGAGSIYFATGYDGESSSVTLPSDGMALKNNNLGLGSWGVSEFPSYKLHVKGTAYATSDMRAPIFYDSNDTNYYLDPNGGSVLSTVRTALKAARGMNGYSGGSWIDDFTNTPVSSMTFGEDKSSGGPSGTWWFQVNMRHQNGSNIWGTQLAYGWEDNANRILQRNVTGGTWTSWVEYLNSNNYTTWAPTKTGGGASGTWSISITGSAASAFGVSNTPDSWYGFGQSTSAGGATAVGGYYPWTFSYHTGLAFNAHSAYGGIRFYNQQYPTAPMHGDPAPLQIINDAVKINGNAAIHAGNIGSQSVSYASTAGSANSVAWGNVSSRPTALSQFSNDSGYITSSGNAASSNVATYARRIDGVSRVQITVGGNASTFYPVALSTGAGSTSQQYAEFVIERGGYDDPGYTGVGFSTFNARFSYKPSGWGYEAKYWNLEQLGQTTTMLADYDDYYQASQFVVWLRGGTTYWIWAIVGGISVVFENTSGTSYNATYRTFGTTTTVAARASTSRNYYGNLRVDNNIYSGGSLISGYNVELGGSDAGNVVLTTYNNRNLRLTGTGGSDVGICGRRSGGSFGFQLYGEGTAYGFLNYEWGAWNLKKVISGALYMNDNNSYYINTTGDSSFSGALSLGGALTVAGVSTLNGQVYINRHIDANTTWGSCGCNTIFVGWSTSKVVIGNGNSGGHDYANGLGSNSVVSTNPFYCYQDITAYSDSRVKENVEVIEDAVEKIKAIRGVTFTRNDVEDLNKRHAGVIAQEILQVLPEAVSEDSRGHLSVAYGNLTSLLIEAIKEQQTQIEDLKNKLDLLTQNK